MNRLDKAAEGFCDMLGLSDEMERSNTKFSYKKGFAQAQATLERQFGEYSTFPPKTMIQFLQQWREEDDGE